MQPAKAATARLALFGSALVLFALACGGSDPDTGRPDGSGAESAESRAQSEDEAAPLSEEEAGELILEETDAFIQELMTGLLLLNPPFGGGEAAKLGALQPRFDEYASPDEFDDFVNHLSMYKEVLMIGGDPSDDVAHCGSGDLAAESLDYLDIKLFAVGITRDGFGAVSTLSAFDGRGDDLEQMLRDSNGHFGMHLPFFNPGQTAPAEKAEWNFESTGEFFSVNNKFDASGGFVTFEGESEDSEWDSLYAAAQSLIFGEIMMVPFVVDGLPEDTSFSVTVTNFDTTNPDADCFVDYALSDDSGQPLGDVTHVREALATSIELIETDPRLSAPLTFVPPATFLYEDPVPAAEFDPDLAMELLQEAGWYDDNGTRSFREPFGFDAEPVPFEHVIAFGYDPLDDLTTCTGAQVHPLELDPQFFDIGAFVLGISAEDEFVISMHFPNIGQTTSIPDYVFENELSIQAGVEAHNPELEPGLAPYLANQYILTFIDSASGNNLSFDSFLLEGNYETTVLGEDGDPSDEPSVDSVGALLQLGFPGDYFPSGTAINLGSTNNGDSESCRQDRVDLHAELVISPQVRPQEFRLVPRFP